MQLQLFLERYNVYPLFTSINDYDELLTVHYITDTSFRSYTKLQKICPPFAQHQFLPLRGSVGGNICSKVFSLLLLHVQVRGNHSKVFTTSKFVKDEPRVRKVPVTMTFSEQFPKACRLFE